MAIKVMHKRQKTWSIKIDVVVVRSHDGGELALHLWFDHRDGRLHFRHGGCFSSFVGLLRIFHFHPLCHFL